MKVRDKWNTLHSAISDGCCFKNLRRRIFGEYLAEKSFGINSDAFLRYGVRVKLPVVL